MVNSKNLISKELFIVSLTVAIRKFSPKYAFSNPVMATVWIGTSILFLQILYYYGSGIPFHNELPIFFWLLITLFFANFAESVAEGRGKARADSLRKTRSKTISKKVDSVGDLNFKEIISSELKVNDIVYVKAGDTIPGDGEVVFGIASVDESAVTGESAPVIRESGGDRSAVTGGTRVISDHLYIKITTKPGESFIDKMITMIEGATRQKTPNEIALGIVLFALTVLFLLTVLSMIPIANFVGSQIGQNWNFDFSVWLALFVCLIPTTIAALLSAIGISGMERLIRCNVIAKSGKAVEAAGDIHVLLLDKTGTITLGNREAHSFYPAVGVNEEDLADASQLSSLSDETPEGRSIVVLAKQKYAIRERNLISLDVRWIPFSASTRMSGVEIYENGKLIRNIRKGASDSIKKYIESLGGTVPESIQKISDEISKRGSTPIFVAEGERILGLIELKDIVKGGLKERFATLRRMGIRTVMITGDNPLTAAAIAAEAGVDDFIAEATPEAKLKRIREEQSNGYLVAMIGDGTNDAPALAQSDVGVAMNTGTQTAREAGNMIDLDSNPSKLIEIVEIGKQLLMTRGALTTFSIANDVAKYFAILPALFLPLAPLNIMHLSSPDHAILAAVIFNALVIPILIPLALRGVKYVPKSPDSALLRNFLIYGGGGMVFPFLGIKLIDLMISGGSL
ncbi:K(+)-transporting ATPase subunit B [Leptospira congkakensis]|uniref:Potassium-transporting ATPase ATP-binding subunit n=1 Tax=Leptospira congkakensis TaxID=2484932 RepID=A0A4Z1A7E8_9LEPT|nr:potassium-transporting ATPase subunit KdpB [Leptospira congkakensis]TGL90940.1 K(+)-transporting ATPase subunit B [Leptospira congkakensis]TGL91949.1 K(+)-transporting ATPase subunit B [Leptospira congkakensis]TGL98999.1 K(+)-transporting ATPase subunit B [Leptospira congkakensis]